ncbi:hypothetical protein IX95_18480 [Vibrio sp. B183]|nr:hypothetical protein IX95_18480 [Vibrio sp. B183]
MVQQDIVFIWLVGPAFAASLMVILKSPLGSKSLSLVKSRFEFFMTANLPFAFGSQVKFALRQLAVAWL